MATPVAARPVQAAAPVPRQRDARARYVFPDVLWRARGETARRAVQLIVDTPRGVLVVADAAGQIDSFEFGDVIMYGCPSEIDSDSRQKVTLVPWRSMVRACAAYSGSAPSCAESNLSGASAATVAPAGHDSAALAAAPIDCASARSNSNATTLSYHGQHVRETGRSAWICYLNTSVARFFTQTATSLGVVQSGINDAWTISRYEGTGGFADVYAAKGDRGITGAVKIMKASVGENSEVTDKCWHKFVDEVRALRDLQGCPTVPIFYGAYLIRSREASTTSTHLSLAMQHFEASLEDIRAAGPLSELVVRPILKDIFRALRFMHAKCYAHRDVKIPNVMLRTPAGPAYLIDFGFAMPVTEGVKIRTFAGTAGYVAPELFGKARWDQRQADIFSSACVGYNLVSKVHIFHGEDDAAVLKQNQRCDVCPALLSSKLSHEFEEVLTECFQLKPKARATAKKALQSRWFELRADRLRATKLQDGDPRWPLQQRALGIFGDLTEVDRESPIPFPGDGCEVAAGCTMVTKLSETDEGVLDCFVTGASARATAHQHAGAPPPRYAPPSRYAGHAGSPSRSEPLEEAPPGDALDASQVSDDTVDGGAKRKGNREDSRRFPDFLGQNFRVASDSVFHLRRLSVLA
jgi:serine/threonine protein kinase